MGCTDRTESNDTLIIRILEEKEKDKGTESLFKAVMAGHLQRFGKRNEHPDS